VGRDCLCYLEDENGEKGRWVGICLSGNEGPTKLPERLFLKRYWYELKTDSLIRPYSK